MRVTLPEPRLCPLNETRMFDHTRQQAGAYLLGLVQVLIASFDSRTKVQMLLSKKTLNLSLLPERSNKDLDKKLIEFYMVEDH